MYMNGSKVMLDYGKMYSKMHENQKVFPGTSIKNYVKEIAQLVNLHKPRNLIDYGSGKGFQYLVNRVHEKWGGLLPYLYDVGVRQLSTKPEGSFDGVICTDVMEHIAEEDVDEILKDIFSLVPKRDDGGTSFAFFSVACRPAAKKKLPDGRNVHLTVKPPEWWTEKFLKYRRDGLVIKAEYDLG